MSVFGVGVLVGFFSRQAAENAAEIQIKISSAQRSRIPTPQQVGCQSALGRCQRAAIAAVGVLRSKLSRLLNLALSPSISSLYMLNLSLPLSTSSRQ